MTLFKATLGSLIGFALLLGVAPFALAQTAPQYYNYNYCNQYPYNTTYSGNYNYVYPNNSIYPTNTYPYNNSNCPHGTLFVYVQINQPGIYNITQTLPSSFSISVAGQYVSQPTFPGSSSGTTVLLVGAYSVSAAQFQGYTPTYSAGCTGNLGTNSQATCIITENPTNSYPYQYQNPQYPQYPQQLYPTPYTYQQYTQPTVVTTFVPSVPNTGFEPQNGSTIAFAVVAVIVATLLAFAYVRKALAYIVG